MLVEKSKGGLANIASRPIYIESKAILGYFNASSLNLNKAFIAYLAIADPVIGCAVGCPIDAVIIVIQEGSINTGRAKSFITHY